MSSQLQDPNYLLTRQYRDASNLNARVQLHQRFSTNPYGWHRWVFDQLVLPPVTRVLELGCGPAYLWLENLDRIPESWNITLSDFSVGMLDESRRNLRPGSERFHFALSDAQAIPFLAQTFDGVIANHMLYHVPDRPKAFSEIRRVMKPGGQFFAATNGDGHLEELFELENQIGAGDLARFSMPFTLENGGEQLAPWFAKITLRRYTDALVITRTEPLLAYLLSGVARQNLNEEQLTNISRTVEQEIAQHGAFRVTKDAGLFIATNEDSL